MGLCTPCAGTRPGAADPTRSKAAYPPPHLVVLSEESSVLVSDDLRLDDELMTRESK